MERDAAGEGVRLVNPRFYGRDEKGQAYVISAKEAVRDPKQGNEVSLTAPEVSLNSEGELTTKVRSDTGTYRESDKTLRLHGKVRLEDGRGYRFDTEEALVDTETNVVRGGKPLQGVGPAGAISADSYTIYDQGARTRFSGRVRARIERGGGSVAPAQGEAR